ncbi:hypothetical protein D9M69_660730 [compost metagenome]
MLGRNRVLVVAHASRAGAYVARLRTAIDGVDFGLPAQRVPVVGPRRAAGDPSLHPFAQRLVLRALPTGELGVLLLGNGDVVVLGCSIHGVSFWSRSARPFLAGKDGDCDQNECWMPTPNWRRLMSSPVVWSRVSVSLKSTYRFVRLDR